MAESARRRLVGSIFILILLTKNRSLAAIYLLERFGLDGAPQVFVDFELVEVTAGVPGASTEQVD